MVRTSRKLDEVEAELSETREMLRLANLELKAWRRGKALPALATEIMRNQAQTEDYKRRAEPK